MAGPMLAWEEVSRLNVVELERVLSSGFGVLEKKKNKHVNFLPKVLTSTFISIKVTFFPRNRMIKRVPC